MAEISIREAQEKVDQWIRTYGVRYFNELTNMAILTEEVGEVARLIARTYGEQSFRKATRSTTSATRWPMSSGSSSASPTKQAST